MERLRGSEHQLEQACNQQATIVATMVACFGHRYLELPADWSYESHHMHCGHLSKGCFTTIYMKVLVWDGVESSPKLARCMDKRKDWRDQCRNRLTTSNLGTQGLWGVGIGTM